MGSGDDSVCHNNSDARILSFALKLHLSLDKPAGPGKSWRHTERKGLAVVIGRDMSWGLQLQRTPCLIPC